MLTDRFRPGGGELGTQRRMSSPAEYTAGAYSARVKELQGVAEFRQTWDSRYVPSGHLTDGKGFLCETAEASQSHFWAVGGDPDDLRVGPNDFVLVAGCHRPGRLGFLPHGH